MMTALVIAFWLAVLGLFVWLFLTLITESKLQSPDRVFVWLGKTIAVGMFLGIVIFGVLMIALVQAVRGV